MTGISISYEKLRSESEIALLAASHNSFAIGFYRELAREDGNVFCSPYSLYNVLTMTAAGARTGTALEFGEVLRFPEKLRTDRPDVPWDLSPIHFSLASINGSFESQEDSGIKKKIEELERAYKDSCVAPLDSRSERDSMAIMDRLKAREAIAYERLTKAREELPKFDLQLANSIWHETSLTILDEYYALIAEYYAGGGIFEADFKGNPLKAKRRIESWVYSRTHGRIDINVIVSSLTRLVLVNSIYFKGSWKEPFDEENTEPRDFILTGGDTIKTPMMSSYRNDEARYA